MHITANFYRLIALISIFVIQYSNLNPQQWVNVTPFINEFGIVFGDFISEDEGWAIHMNSNGEPIYHTTDGTQTWESISTEEDSLGGVGYFLMIDENIGWIVTGSGSEYQYHKTSDGCHNWEDMSIYLSHLIHESLASIFFINNDIGFIAGKDSLSSNYTIHKTNNGGYEWYETNSPVIIGGEYITNIFFIDEMHGWALGSYFASLGYCLYTDDGGENWEVLIEPGHVEFWDMQFIDCENGGICGRNSNQSVVLITENNFETILYEHNYYDLELFASAICFQNENALWIAGEPGKIILSTTGGESFEFYQTTEVSYVSDIQFFDNTGYLFGNNNSLLKFTGTDAIDDPIISTITFSVYPNPTSDKVYTKFPSTEKEVFKIDVYNIKGQKVICNVIENKQNDIYVIDCIDKNLRSGIYYLNIRSNRYQFNNKFTFVK